jgi:hypothetical protein
MPTPFLTAPDRLKLLLPWLNGAYTHTVPRKGLPPEDAECWTDYAQVRQAVDEFLKSFDGSKNAAHLVAEPDDEALEPDALDDLAARLGLVLEQGFGEPTLQSGMCLLPLTGITLAVAQAGRVKPGWRVTKGGNHVRTGREGEGIQAKRAWLSAGAYRLRVQGSALALVPFLVAHLLTQAEMVRLARCKRRGDPNWLDCPNFFVTDPTQRGRPREYCAPSCRVRHEEQIAITKKLAAAARREAKKRRS